jgi:two-component system, response regulator / RNA-binding antiterminator
VAKSDVTILIADDSAERAQLIEQGLRDAGHLNVTVAGFNGILSRIEELSPDVIVMDLGNPNRDFLEHMFRLSKAVQKPIAMFVDQSSSQAMLDAIEAGVSAYVVDGLRRERVKPILDLAIGRFRAFEQIRSERDEARHALEARNIIDKAKRVVMREKAMNEDEAYALLRTTAMNKNRTITEIAHAVVLASETLGGTAQ